MNGFFKPALSKKATKNGARNSQKQPQAARAWSSQKAARTSQEQPISSQKQPGATRSSQEQPKAARSSQKQAGAARSSQGQKK